VSHSNPERPPIVDARVLKRLRNELGADAEYSSTFVEHYLTQLPLRTARLRDALMAADRTAALDTVLSLKTASWMVGAICLGTVCKELEFTLNGFSEEELEFKMPALCDPDQIMDRIDHCSRRTAKMLGPEEAART
jgi:HPt (histidine-containing phosphotransfer) domain-containing protein